VRDRGGREERGERQRRERKEREKGGCCLEETFFRTSKREQET
jgi:hypothetical protein